MLTVAPWKAPYSADCMGDFVPPERASASPGDVLLLRVRWPLSADCEALERRLPDAVRQIRRASPASPVAVWLPDVPLQGACDATRAASQAQVRAILGGEACPELLRAQLTSPIGLSAFVLRWASDTGYLPDGMEPEDVRCLLDAPPNVRTLQRLAAHRQVAARTWRNRLQHLGLPTPAAWLALAHALHVAFYVQRNAHEPVQTLCDRLGMVNVATMSQRFHRVFGLSPRQVRDVLGAEPLLDRWFRVRARRSLATA